MAARETREIRVSCVARNRWNEDHSPRPVFRAPLSVMAAGFTYNKGEGLWTLDSAIRQDQVWAQIKRFEDRSGERKTNSLKQIMSEDLKTLNSQKQIVEHLNSNHKIYPKQNGVLIALDEQPLVSEFFSNP